MRLKYLKKIIVVLFFLMPVHQSLGELNNKTPLMLKDKNYTEYWEQYFYLSDGSLVTSQFLVANFPWPVGDDHGIMLGTLVTPKGELYVIKNGRDLGKWGYSDTDLDMFIHTHRLRKTDNGYNLHLENTMGIVDLALTSQQSRIDHNQLNSDNGTLNASFYAPYLTGYGNWQLGPEAGFDPSGPVHNAEKLNGFGVHVAMNDKVDQFIDSWTRAISVNENGPKLFLSSIKKPDGKEDTILNLIGEEQLSDSFSDVKIKYHDMTDEKDASYPRSISIKAKGEKGTLEGTIDFTKKMGHFNLIDHLNFFERSFAKSNPSIFSFRYIADYNLVYKTDNGAEELTGKALTEYADITPAKKAPKKRRRNRR